jgi:hypothetical protein
MPIQSMAGRQDLVLARKVDDLRQKVFELAAVSRCFPLYSRKRTSPRSRRFAA